MMKDVKTLLFAFFRTALICIELLHCIANEDLLFTLLLDASKFEQLKLSINQRVSSYFYFG